MAGLWSLEAARCRERHTLALNIETSLVLKETRMTNIRANMGQCLELMQWYEDKLSTVEEQLKCAEEGLELILTLKGKGNSGMNMSSVAADTLAEIRSERAE